MAGKKKSQGSEGTVRDICNTCNIDIDNGLMIECDRCEKWICKDCTGLNDEVFNFYDKNPGVSIWYCPPCRASAMKAVKSDNLIEERCKAHFETFKKEVDQMIKEKFDQVQENLQTTETSLKKEDESIRREINELKELLDNKISKITDEAASQSVQEVQERRNREKSAMLFKLKESTHIDAEERKKEDLQHINEICTILDVKVDVGQATRIGKKEDDKIRPLKITLNTSQQVESLIKAARKLKDCKRKEYEGVVVKNDMTPMEREEMKKLLKLRDQKREESRTKGETVNWIIKGKKVVKGKPPEAVGETA